MNEQGSLKQEIKRLVKLFFFTVSFFIGSLLVFLSAGILSQQEEMASSRIEIIMLENKEEEEGDASPQSAFVEQGGLKMREFAPVSPMEEVNWFPQE